MTITTEDEYGAVYTDEAGVVAVDDSVFIINRSILGKYLGNISSTMVHFKMAVNTFHGANISNTDVLLLPTLIVTIVVRTTTNQVINEQSSILLLHERPYCGMHK